MSDQGNHFINHIVSELIEEFQIHHKKSTTYHPQGNGTVESFNKILEHVLTKVCNANRDDWELKIPIVLWAYHTTCNILTGKTSFKLVYVQEAVMPMEYIVPSLCIAVVMGLDNEVALEERVEQLVHLEEDQFIEGLHQCIEKDQQKTWNDRHIKNK